MTCWGTVDHPPPVAGCELLRKDGSIGAEERELEETSSNNNTPGKEKVFQNRHWTGVFNEDSKDRTEDTHTLQIWMLLTTPRVTCIL